MDHFAGQTMNDFLAPNPQQQPQQNDPHSGPTWPPSDFNSFIHQQQHRQHHSQQQYHGEGPFNANSLGAIYVSNIPLMTHPPQQPTQPPQQFDENGQPIKIRKKPGRKPNPASPALRKAQNRAAQRAFRERKERHLKDLEGTIRQLREQRNSAVKELNQTKSKMDSFRAENWYLKGVVLTLQFVCLHHSIHIPTHSPYLTEEALSEMAKKTPHAIEAYVNAYTRNNINLKPTMAAHFANTANEKDSPKQQSTELADDDYNENSKRDTEMIEDDEEYDEQERSSDNPLDETTAEQSRYSLSPSSPSFVKIEEEDDETMTQWLKQHNENKKRREQEELEKKEKAQETEKSEEAEGDDIQPNPSSISAIQRIRLQLKLQSTISNIGKSAARLQPTILQLAIPHDPRIDLIPTPHMRDRMIIFRDQMDYDRCFAMLLNGANYHGGDPTMSASWELPPEFFTEFWYLAINYDINRANTWRRLKGLPEINETIQQQQQPLQQQQQQHHHTLQEEDWNDPQQPTNVFHQSNSFSPPSSSSGDTVWTDDVFAQMTAGMPTLQPLDSNHLSSGFDFGSPTNMMMEQPFLLHRAGVNPNEISEGAHAMFEQLMRSSPDSRHQRSPSIGAMMDLMNSLSTDLPTS